MNAIKNQGEESPSDQSPVDKKHSNETNNVLRGYFSRRSFMRKGLVAGAGTAALGLMANNAQARDGLTSGDAAILRFLAAAEILETDAWQQYNELGGVQDAEVPGGERQ